LRHGDDQTVDQSQPNAELVGELRARVEDLREQLAEEREARRRADTIIAQLARANEEQARTIRELEAPSEPPSEERETPQTVEEPEGAEPPPHVGRNLPRRSTRSRRRQSPIPLRQRLRKACGDRGGVGYWADRPAGYVGEGRMPEHIDTDDVIAQLNRLPRTHSTLHVNMFKCFRETADGRSQEVTVEIYDGGPDVLRGFIQYPANVLPRIPILRGSMNRADLWIGDPAQVGLCPG
jgi:hypothetical protein